MWKICGAYVINRFVCNYCYIMLHDSSPVFKLFRDHICHMAAVIWLSMNALLLCTKFLCKSYIFTQRTQTMQFFKVYLIYGMDYVHHILQFIPLLKITGYKLRPVLFWWYFNNQLKQYYIFVLFVIAVEGLSTVYNCSYILLSCINQVIIVCWMQPNYYLKNVFFYLMMWPDGL